MKTKPLLLFVALISTIILSECKKYDDGPRISLLSKKSRLANAWKYEKVIDQSGHDVPFATDYFIEFKKDGNVIETYGNNIYPGTWLFATNKEDIVLNVPADTRTVSILRLKSKELWLTDQSHAEYHLIPR